MTLCFAVTSASMYSSYNRLKSIPGPIIARHTRLWLLQALYSEECAQRYVEANETYGASSEYPGKPRFRTHVCIMGMN